VSDTSQYSIETFQRIELIFDTQATLCFSYTVAYGNPDIYANKVNFSWNCFSEFWTLPIFLLFTTVHRRQKFITLSVHVCLQHVGRERQLRHARLYAEAAYATAQCLCVYLRDWRRLLLCRNDWTDRTGILAHKLPSIYRTLCIRKFAYLQNWRHFLLELLPQLWTWNNFATARRPPQALKT